MITRRQYLKQATLATCGLALAHALPAEPTTEIEGKHSLKAHAHKRGLLAGCAVSAANLHEEAFTKVLAEQYSLVVPENCMKFGFVHPAADRYDFADGDALVAFAEQHKIKVRGHNFVWHEALPAWFAGTVTKDNAKKFLTEHILTVGGRYKGKMQSWDVVNEALNDDGTLRKSPWLNIIGEDYIAKAFQFAHEADPAAELYYNDYSLENEAKRKGAVELVKKLKAQGITVTAVGLQGHDKLDWPTAKQQADTIEAFAALGVKVCITELDVDVLPRNAPGTSADISATSSGGAGLNPYTAGLPDAVQQELARRYAELFDIFVKYRASISRVTFWGVTDAGSWLNNFPIRGRTNYPMLFDREGKPKAAFFAVMKTAK